MITVTQAARRVDLAGPDTDQSAKADGGKSNPCLLQQDMARALYLCNRVLDYGAQKYARQSWNTVSLRRWDAAHRRHQIAMDLGETVDDESGLPHRAHQIIGLLIMLELEMGDIPLKVLKQAGEFKEPPQNHKEESDGPITAEDNEGPAVPTGRTADCPWTYCRDGGECAGFCRSTDRASTGDGSKVLPASKYDHTRGFYID